MERVGLHLLPSRPFYVYFLPNSGIKCAYVLVVTGCYCHAARGLDGYLNLAEQTEEYTGR